MKYLYNLILAIIKKETITRRTLYFSLVALLWPRARNMFFWKTLADLCVLKEHFFFYTQKSGVMCI